MSKIENNVGEREVDAVAKLIMRLTAEKVELERKVDSYDRANKWQADQLKEANKAHDIICERVSQLQKNVDALRQERDELHVIVRDNPRETRIEITNLRHNLDEAKATLALKAVALNEAEEHINTLVNENVARGRTIDSLTACNKRQEKLIFALRDEKGVNLGELSRKLAATEVPDANNTMRAQLESAIEEGRRLHSEVVRMRKAIRDIINPKEQLD